SDQFPLMDRNRSILPLRFLSIIDWARVCSTLQLLSLFWRVILYWDDLSSREFSLLSLLLSSIYAILVISSITLVAASIKFSSDNCVVGAAFCSILLSFVCACLAPTTSCLQVRLSQLPHFDPRRLISWSPTLHSSLFLLFSLPVNVVCTIVYGTLTEHFENIKNGCG
ncbi:hypothetical protein PFISCL1PPCAC_8171, partial [Pristionchus fissidentatus]